MPIDLQRLSRRRLLELGALGALGAAGAVGLAACGSDGNGSAASSSGQASTTTTTTGGTSGSTAAAADATECTVIPEETGGPYPGDGTNGPDVLSESGVVRSDITSSFGDATGTAAGIPTRIELTVVNASAGCTPVKEAAVYVWHCDAQGRYSMYSNGVTNENFLRGVQSTAADGTLAFHSIFPGCYSGRWPHIHFEVYPGVGQATSASGRIATSQIALPRDVCNTVYGSSTYPGSASNLASLSLDSDMVFGDDGAVHEMATVTGNAADGYTVALRVPVLFTA
jgi:protocatechuate 3,4-dioxygenase beta subunit